MNLQRAFPTIRWAGLAALLLTLAALAAVIMLGAAGRLRAGVRPGRWRCAGLGEQPGGDGLHLVVLGAGGLALRAGVHGRFAQRRLHAVQRRHRLWEHHREPGQRPGDAQRAGHRQHQQPGGDRAGHAQRPGHAVVRGANLHQLGSGIPN